MRVNTLTLTVESKQLEEVVNSIFHTILFHRTTGKFHYKQEGAFLIGTVGVVETDCDFVDLTFVRCNSPTLDKNLRREVSAFKDVLRSTDVNAGLQSGQISLEFYQKKKNRWPFPDESIPWEVWTLKINVISLSNEQERQAYREKLGEILNAKIICIVEAMITFQRLLIRLYWIQSSTPPVQMCSHFYSRFLVKTLGRPMHLLELLFGSYCEIHWHCEASDWYLKAHFLTKCFPGHSQ
ncbi:hypothetical protein BSL78_08013 [Apostichopus japonicus]|uniref:Autophagy-related protein 101 n=1 Tax=Stichopus japonicus TaxID=307972 RepID=A0A2G8L471_STIJA|nr:hypothetical protein BSL78_08013 [Apostichopus japonicus]